jgi:hypothetical protein
LERIKGARSALQSLGTGTDPFQRSAKPQISTAPVPALSDAPERVEANLALQSLGTGTEQRPFPTVPVPNRSEIAETGQIGDISENGNGEEDALLAALAALRRAGLSRSQARALGARFRNDDWSRAARMVREGEGR